MWEVLKTRASTPAITFTVTTGANDTTDGTYLILSRVTSMLSIA